MNIFIDTSAYIALMNKNDQYHNSAKTYYKKQLKSGLRLMTTNFVICETLNFLRAKSDLNIAVKFWENIKKSKIVEEIHVTTDTENNAFELFKKYSDKDFSFTDCTSFVVMKQYNLTTSFTFDEHFRQIGFLVVPPK